MQTILEEAHESYPTEIVHELSSNTPDELEQNLNRILLWIEEWKHGKWSSCNNIFLFWKRIIHKKQQKNRAIVSKENKIHSLVVQKYYKYLRLGKWELLFFDQSNL